MAQELQQMKKQLSYNNHEKNATSDNDSSITDEETENLTRPPLPKRATVYAFTPVEFNNVNFESDLIKDADSQICAKGTLFVLIMFVFAIGFTTMIHVGVDWGLSKSLSLSFGIMYMFYFGHLIYYLTTANEIYRIHSLHGKIPNWLNMSITLRQICFKYSPMDSISELAAVSGGISNYMLLVVSILSFFAFYAKTLSHMQMEKTWLHYANNHIMCPYNKCAYNYKELALQGSTHVTDSTLMILGSFGSIMLALFELDPFSKKMKLMHYLGVVLIFCCPSGFIVQTVVYHKTTDIEHKVYGRVIFSISMLVISLLCIFLWIFIFSINGDKLDKYYREHPPKTTEEKKMAAHKVKVASIKNLSAELIAVFVVAASGTMWLYWYDDTHVNYNPGVIGGFPDGPWGSLVQFIQTKYHCRGDIIQFDVNQLYQYCNT